MADVRYLNELLLARPLRWVAQGDRQSLSRRAHYRCPCRGCDETANVAIACAAVILPARVDARDEVALDTGSLLVVVLLFVKVGDVLEGSLVLEACVYPCKLE